MNSSRQLWQTDGSRQAHAGWLTRWWNQPGQFDWLSAYLNARGLSRPARFLMAVLSGALVLVPLGAINSRFLALSVILSGVAVLTGVVYALIWLHGWPTRAQSLTMGLLGAALIAVCSVLQSQPIVALMGCCALVIIGGYLAFFHSTKAIICTIFTACVAGTICAVRVAALPDHTLVATAGLWMVIELNIAVPLAIQMTVHTLGADVVRSDHDALTGVLNRRAFYERARALLTIPGPETELVVVMIDLDHFKHVNDTYGHSAGDQALTAVGWALRHNCADSALIGRAGGEEFLVIDRQAAKTAHLLPAKLCRAIAELPHPVTASVGAAVTSWYAVPDPGTAVETLVKAADTAMYHAKRNGGNQVSVQTLARAYEHEHRGRSAEPP